MIDTLQPQADSRTGRGIMPWLAALFLGSAAIGAWFLIKPAIDGGRYYKVGFNRTTYEYSREVLLLFVPYALTIWAWRRGHRVSLKWLLGGAIVLHILVLLAPLPQSQDLYQYLFYGRMQAVHGANPYVLNPSIFWADRWFPWIRWSDQTSVYGPVWMLTAWGAAKAAGNSLALGFVLLKGIVLALDLSIMAMIVSLGRHRPDGEDAAGFGILAYAWNPLVLVTVPLGGAADVALGAALLAAVLARKRGRTYLATALLTLGGMVKLYGMIGVVLHVVLVWRERGVKAAARHAGLAVGIVAVLYAPYWRGMKTFSGLLKAAGLTNESLIGLLQRVLAPVLLALGYHTPRHGAEVAVRLLGGALLLGAVAWAVAHVRDERSFWYSTLVVLVAYCYLTPWYLYWYAIAPLTLVAALPRNRLTYPVLLLTGASLVKVGHSNRLLNMTGQAALRYLPPGTSYVLGRRPEPAVHRGGVVPTRIPVPATAATLQQAPAAK
jgi:hypothetical protein